MVSDPIADTLTIIRNGYMARLPKIRLVNTKMNRALCEVLAKEGFVGNVNEKERDLNVKLRYVFDDSELTRLPVIKHISRVSKPGRRVYFNKDQIKKVRGGLGMFVLTTPQGVMSGESARTNGVGGEVICKVW